MKKVRGKLTYANVISSLALFLVLSGGAAFAASQLAKNSVGTKQLKKNSVTAAKIKKNAVTAAKLKAKAVTGAKIADGAVTGAKIAAGAVTGANINVASTPFSQVVARLRGESQFPLSGTAAVYPLNNPTYTQPAGEDDNYLGAVDVTFSAACTQPRSAAAYLLIDAENPLVPTPENIIGVGQIENKGSGATSRRVNVGPYIYGAIRFAPKADTPHTLTLLTLGTCTTGSGITATFGGVDVIGTK